LNHTLLFRFIIILLFSVLYSVTNAQNFTTRGTNFWLGFMENFYATGDLYVYITSEVSTTGTISIPLQGWTQNFTVTPGVTTQITVPFAQAHTVGSGAIRQTGINILANDTVTVFNLNYMPNTADATVILPIQTIGNQYYVMAYTDNQTFSQSSEFLIVGCYNNTQIEITPRVATISGQAANVPYTITLNEGQTYQLQANGDLTGSLVRSIDNGVGCPNFALYAGNICTGVQCAYCDHLNEQLYPTYTWGQEYVIPPLRTRANSRYRVMAQDAGTIVNVNGGPNINLNAGQFNQFDLPAAGFVTANKPISLAQFSKGSDCDNTSSDPFSLMLSPTNQQLTQITFNAFTSTIITAYYLNVVTRTTNTNIVTLDGNNIGNQFVQVPANNAWSYAQLTITQGDHTLRSDSGFVAYVYGYGNDESYGYPVGANLTNIFAAFNYAPADSTIDTSYICPNTIIRFRGVGDSTVSTYEWDFGDGNYAVGRNTFHSYANFGIYEVKMIISRLNACGKDTLSNIIRVLGPTPNIISADTICLGSSLTINAAPTSGTYTWSTGATSQSITVAPTVTTSYWVYIEDSLCRGKPDTITVYVSNPIADFSFAEECVGDSVRFNNLSTSGLDSIVTYLWNFGDGNTSAEINPVHLYTTAGNFNVTLSITSELGCTNTKTMQLVNHAIPVAAFTTQNVCEGTATQFNDGSTISQGSINTWNWSFGDGGNSILASPQRQYVDTGTYDVQLIVSSLFGCSDTVINPVTVYLNPTADFTAANECNGVAINFNNGSTVGSNISYNWNMGDGNNSTLQNPSYTYASAGIYNVTLIATTTDNCADTITKTIESYALPDAQFTFSNVCDGATAVFTNTSTIALGTFISEWRFGDGNTNSTLSPTHLYVDSGTYTVSLVVLSNNNCVDSISNDITVFQQPIANWTANNECFGTAISFQDASYPQASGLTYNWDFNDGNTAATANASNDYAIAGSYDVTLVISTANGCSDSLTNTVVVYPKPQADFSINNTCLNDIATYTSNATIVSGTIQQTDWSLGDGAVATGNSGTHVYGAAGNYTVQLQVVSNFGCGDSLSKTVTVYPLPTATTSSTIACYDENNAEATVVAQEGTPPYEYLWSDGQSDATATNLFAGNYDVTVTDINDCKVVLSETVNEQPFPVLIEPNFAIDTIRFGDTISVVSVSGNYDPFLTYSWKPSEGLGCDTCSNTFAAPLASVTYIIVATDTLGCVGETSVEIIVVNDYIIYIPNAFTPNADGINDVFKVNAKGVKEIYLNVFNRWGEKIFASEQLDNGWDGTYLGKEMSPQVYVYSVQLIFLDGYKMSKKGSVTLIR
jgi:gliding motility-associated-like protein